MANLPSLFLRLCLLAAGFSGCTSMSVRSHDFDKPLFSILYESGDAVGIIQKLEYFDDNRIRLLGADQRVYSSEVEDPIALEVENRLKDRAVIREVKTFGSSPRCPEYLVTETLTIQLGDIVRKGRLDALSGSLVSLTSFLESALPPKLRRRYQISIIERLAIADCVGSPDGLNG